MIAVAQANAQPLFGAMPLVAGPLAALPPEVTLGVARVVSFVLVLPLAIRRTHPEESAALVGALAFGQLALGFPALLPANLAVLVSVYSVTGYGIRRAGRVALWVAMVGTVAMGMRFSQAGLGSDTPFLVVAAMLLTLAAWALGRMRWAQLSALLAAQAQSAALAQVSAALTERNVALTQRNEALDVQAVSLEMRARQLEHERDQQALIATAAERARIAREMHDIVGHAITNIVVFARGAAAAGDPALALQALETIAETGTAALGTTRQLLGLLRDEEAGPLRPPPGNIGTDHSAADPTGIAQLVTEVTAAGTSVELTQVGTPRSLPPAAVNTLHRVAQEALTNARRHGIVGAPVRVELRWESDCVALEVANQVAGIDDHPAGGAAGGAVGYGLIGMRERAELVGGTLTAGYIAADEGAANGGVAGGGVAGEGVADEGLADEGVEGAAGSELRTDIVARAPLTADEKPNWAPRLWRVTLSVPREG